MDNEKYTVSLIDSIEDYVYKLQYLGHNKRTTIRALNTYKILHWLYSWADWYEVSEADKLKIEELMNCLILRNSTLVLPIIQPELFYSNVSSPQNMWTWRILSDENNGGEINTKTLTIQSNGQSSVNIVLNKEDLNGDQNGVTSFTRLYSYNEIIQITAPLSLPSTYLFDYWTIDGVRSSSESNTISVTMSSNHTIVSYYREPEVLVGTLIINKQVLNSEGVTQAADETEFTISLIKDDLVLRTGVVSVLYPLIFSTLEPGTYSVLEEENEDYTIESTNPRSVIIEGDDNVSITIINQEIPEPVITTGSIIVNKQFSTAISNPGLNDYVFNYVLIGAVNTTPIYRSGTVNSPATFEDIPFDTYTLTEVDDRNFALVNISPTSGVFTLSESNDRQIVTVINADKSIVPTGTVTVNKQFYPPVSNPELNDYVFTYILTGTINTSPIYLTGSITTPAVLSGIGFDTYTLTEQHEPDFELVGISPTSGVFTLNESNTSQEITVINTLSEK